MHSVSSTRKTRKLRMKSLLTLTSNTSEQSIDISCDEAQRELKVRVAVFSQPCRPFLFDATKGFPFYINTQHCRYVTVPHVYLLVLHVIN